MSTHSEYACTYATGEAFGADRPANEDGEFVVVACYVALGMTYPISRAVDYDAPDDADSFSRYYTPPGRPAIALEHNHQSHYGMVKVAVLVRPWLATTGSTVCIQRLEAALRTREERSSTSDPSGRP